MYVIHNTIKSESWAWIGPSLDIRNSVNVRGGAYSCLDLARSSPNGPYFQSPELPSPLPQRVAIGAIWSVIAYHRDCILHLVTKV